MTTAPPPERGEDDGGEASDAGRRWVVLAVGLAVVLFVGALVLVLSGGDDEDQDAGTTTTVVAPGSGVEESATGDPGSDTTDAGPGLGEDAEPDPGDPAQPPPSEGPIPDAVIPVGAIPPGPESQTCPAIVARLREYRDVADETGTSELDQLFDGMTDFEAEIFTLAQNQDWGDRIIEQLVDVRRYWADARALDGSGDETEATEAAGTALDLLDETISSSDCPN